MNAPVPALAILPPETDRRTFLGGSDAAAIMGCGARYDGEEQTAYTVWLKKTSTEAEELDAKKRKFFDRRKRWEPVIVEMLREEFEAEITGVNHRYIDPQHSFLAAEIDFEWRDPIDGSIQNGEIKTVHPWAYGENHGWGEAWTDEVPVHYAAQVMHGLGVTGRRQTIVAAMVGLDTMIFYRLHRDDDTIAAMREKCVRFWFDHVLPKVAPEPSNMKDIMALFSRFNGRAVECTPEIVEALEQLREVRASIKSFKETEEELAFAVAAYVCKQWQIDPMAVQPQAIDNALLLHNGVQVGTWKKQRGASLDQKRFRAEHPDLHAGYMREHWFRPIRISK